MDAAESGVGTLALSSLVAGVKDGETDGGVEGVGRFSDEGEVHMKTKFGFSTSIGVEESSRCLWRKLKRRESSVDVPVADTCVAFPVRAGVYGGEVIAGVGAARETSFGGEDEGNRVLEEESGSGFGGGVGSTITTVGGRTKEEEGMHEDDDEDVEDDDSVSVLQCRTYARSCALFGFASIVS